MSQDGRKIAVLMDGTNAYFELKATDPSLAPQRKRELWVEALTELARRREAGPVSCNPMTVWRELMDARRMEARVRDEQRVGARRYRRNVNRRLLRRLQELGMIPAALVTRACADDLQVIFRELGGPDRYSVNFDVAQFVAWVVEEAKEEPGLDAELFMVTTQRRDNVGTMFRTCGAAQRELFKRVLTADDIGLADKLSVEFWRRVERLTGVPLNRAVVIGSNGITDGYAAVAGAHAVLIVDRDGTYEDYFRGIWEQTTTRGLPLVPHDQPVPVGRFFSFIPAYDEGLRARLLQVKAAILGGGEVGHD